MLGWLLLAGGCTPEPPLASGVTIDRAILGQNTGVLLVDDGEPVLERLQPVIAGREARVRLVLTSDVRQAVEVELTLGEDAIRETVLLEPGSNRTELVVPAELLVEGVDFALAVYDLETGRPGDTSGARVPAGDDTMYLGVRELPPLRVSLVAMVDDGPAPDLSPAYVDEVGDMLYAMFPVTDVDIDVREGSLPFAIIGEGSDGLAAAVDLVAEAHRADGAAPNHLYLGQYYVLGGGGGRAAAVDLDPDKRAAVSPAIEGNPRASGDIAAHELGHLLGAWHAPCVANATHPDFPNPDGFVGVRVWDGLEERWRNASTPDLMGYCPNSWMGPFTGGQLAEGLLWWD